MNYERFYDDTPAGYGYGSDDDDSYSLRPGFDYGDELDYRGDGFDSGFNAPRIAPQWRFLRDFIELVEGRYSPLQPRRYHSDDVRLGRDVDDWWIDVMYENGALVSKYDQLADDRVRCFRTVRDATLLLGVLARVDYEAFLALLIRRGKFDVPTFMNLQHHQLPAQFNIPFMHDLDPQDYAWKILRNVFGDTHYSQDFTTHLATIDEMTSTATTEEDAAARRKRLCAPVKSKLTFNPEATTIASQVEILKNITKMVMEMQNIEKKWAQSADRAPRVPSRQH